MALDVGTARVGVALAGVVARLPRPYRTLHNDDSLWQQLQAICQQESVATVIIGLPRGLDGQETAQTKLSRDFAETLQQKLALPVVLQDEALTSQKAEAELTRRGKDYARHDIDALAATYILDDYLRSEHS